MNQIDLCAGINGFGLAGRWMGWESVATCEIDPFCQRVLKKNFPDAYHHSNLFDLTAHILEKEITNRFGPEWRKPGVILTAGLPCQPFSVAGDRKGQNDPRFLWPTAIGLVRELRPDVCVFENVAGLLSILEPDSVSEMERKTFELFDQDNDESRKVIERVERRVIGRIIEDLEQAGYILPKSADGTPIVFCIPACAVEAIHQRDRVWIVAYAASQQDIGENVGQFQRKPSRSNTQPYSNTKSTIGQRARTSWSGRNGYTDACCNVGGILTNSKQQPSRILETNAGGGQERSTAGAFQSKDFRLENGAAHAKRVGTSGVIGPINVHSNTSGRRRQNGRHGAQQESNRQTGQHGNSDRRPFRQVEWQPNNTSEILRVSYGVPGGLDGRVRNRNARIKACGNAIVPQVAYAIFQAIDAALKNKRP
jgi:site-specific DNA-cytosine methylase